jgi:hypothetical protein
MVHGGLLLSALVGVFLISPISLLGQGFGNRDFISQIGMLLTFLITCYFVARWGMEYINEGNESHLEAKKSMDQLKLTFDKLDENSQSLIDSLSQSYDNLKAISSTSHTKVKMGLSDIQILKKQMNVVKEAMEGTFRQD